jgi:nitrosocyanin
MHRTLTAALLVLGLLVPTIQAHEPKPGPLPMTFTIVNIEYEGSKIWTPATLTVKKGTKVTLKLINNVPSEPLEHGFAIPAYKIAEVVKKGEPKTVEFVADKVGVYQIVCHLHPAHVGGELVVLP